MKLTEKEKRSAIASNLLDPDFDTGPGSDGEHVWLATHVGSINVGYFYGNMVLGKFGYKHHRFKYQRSA